MESIEPGLDLDRGFMFSADLLSLFRGVRRASRRLVAPSSLLLVGFFAAAAVLAQPQRMAISHVAQAPGSPPTLRLYLDVESDGGTFGRSIAPGALRGSLGESALELDAARPFSETDEGVAYIFLVDISASLSVAQFNEIRDAIDAWVSNLGRLDRAAILAFGETSELVVDLTDDTDALRAGLARLGPTDRLTLLHQALADALALSQRRDPDLPDRRVIVVLSDGRDEGSGLVLDDVLARLRDQQMPIYAIGHSQFEEPQRSRDLSVLRRLASNSGGAFFEAERTAFAESYAWIGRAIDRVLVVEARCETCVADGRSMFLQLELDQEGRVLTAGKDVRLLPLAATDQAQAPTTSADAPAVAQPEATTQAAEPATTSDGQRLPLWIWPLVLLGVAAAFASVLLFRRGNRPAYEEETSAAEWRDVPAAAPVSGPVPVQPAPPADPTPATEPAARAGERLRGAPMPSGRLASPTPASLPQVRLSERTDIDSGDDVPLDPERPQRRRVVRLVVVRGNNKGREFRTVLRARAVVGSRSTCDCVLAGEENISKEQFELLQRDDNVYLQNLDEQRPTLLNGLTLRGREQVKTGDLIGTRDTILRLMLD